MSTPARMPPKNWICHWFGHAAPDDRVTVILDTFTGMLISQCPRCATRLRKRAGPMGSWMPTDKTLAQLTREQFFVFDKKNGEEPK